MPWTAWRRMSSRRAERLGERRAALDRVQQLVVRDGDHRVDRSRSSRSALLGLHLPTAPFEGEGLRHHRDHQGADLARQVGDDRRRAGAGAAAEAGGDEHHVGAVERLEDLLGVLERRLRADLRIGAAPSPLVSLAPSWSFIGARLALSACSRCWRRGTRRPRPVDAIMRLTALPPPPPTPMTLMRAAVPVPSSKDSRAGRPRACRLRIGSSAYSSLCLPLRTLRHSSHSRQRRDTFTSRRNRSQNFQQDPDDAAGMSLFERMRCACSTSPMAVAYDGVATTSTSPPTPLGVPQRTGRSKICSATSVRPSSAALPPVKTTPALSTSLEAGALDLVVDQMEDLLRARLEDLRHHLPRQHSRLASADARHLDGVFLRHHASPERSRTSS